jgi:hypothetical protein
VTSNNVTAKILSATIVLADIVALVAAVTLCAIERTTRQAWTCRFSKDNRWG